MIKALDSFRFYAFLAVFLFHVKLFDGGYLGVQAFFVLSGFLLTPILVDTKKNMSFRRYMANFYGRRMLRIFPLYYLYLLGAALFVGIAFALGHHHEPALVLFRKQWLYAATYLYDFFYASAAFRETPLLSHFWSLAVEEQFYLVWPLFIWLVPREKLNRCLGVVVILNPLIRFAIYFAYLRWGLSRFIGDPTRAIYGLPFSHFDAFAIGGLLALAREGRWSRIAFPLAVIAGTAGYAAQYLGADQVVWSSMGYPPFMSGGWKLVWGYSLLNLTFACILKAVKSNTFLPALFSPAPLQYLGKISYGLYVYHYPVIWLFHRLGNGRIPTLLLNAFMLAGTIAVSALSYELFEKQFIALKDRWFRKDGAELRPASARASKSQASAPASAG
jgi:peptidoglycan/LPS O-acetylase OafA/YrhL